MGSIREAKKAPVENIDRAIETLDSSIEPKKVIQCKAIITPANDNFNIFLGAILILVFVNLMKKNTKMTAIIIRYQTKGIALIVINSPNIAVKPAIKTKK